MSDKTCEQMRGDLSAYLDGELSGDQWSRIDRHVRDCPGCAAELAALRDVADRLAALPRRAAPSDLSQVVPRELLRQALEPAVEPVGRPRLWLNMARVAASAALIVLAATVTWRVMRPDRDVADSMVDGQPLAGVEIPQEQRRGFAARTDKVGPADRASDRFAKRSLSLTMSERTPPTAAEGEQTYGQAIVGPAFDANMPTVDVIVAPQTQVEFDRTIGFIRRTAAADVRWVGGELKDETTPTTGRPTLAGLMLNATGGLAEQRIELDVGSDQVWPLIDGLESNAAAQVTVAMNFRAADAGLLNAGSAGEGGPPDMHQVDADARLGFAKAQVETGAESKLNSTDKRAGRAGGDREELRSAASPRAAERAAGRPQAQRGIVSESAGTRARRRVGTPRPEARKAESRVFRDDEDDAAPPGAPPARRAIASAKNRPRKKSADQSAAPVEKTSAARSEARGQRGRRGGGAGRGSGGAPVRSRSRPSPTPSLRERDGAPSKRDGASARAPSRSAGRQTTQQPVRFRIRVMAPPMATTQPATTRAARP